MGPPHEGRNEGGRLADSRERGCDGSRRSIETDSRFRGNDGEWCGNDGGSAGRSVCAPPPPGLPPARGDAPPSPPPPWTGGRPGGGLHRPPRQASVIPAKAGICFNDLRPHSPLPGPHLSTPPPCQGECPTFFSSPLDRGEAGRGVASPLMEGRRRLGWRSLARREGYSAGAAGAGFGAVRSITVSRAAP